MTHNAQGAQVVDTFARATSAPPVDAELRLNEQLAGIRLGAELRRLIAAVEEIGPLLEASTEESERDGRLAESALTSLRASGAMHMRVPVDLGGSELPLAEQMVVLARIAEYDSASAWCAMVANNGIGGIAETTSDEGIAEIFAEGERPIGAAVAAAGGTAVIVDGGYLVNGLWRFCSNVHNADWVRCTAAIDGDVDRPVMLVVPHADLRIRKTWNVTGMRGTGSADFELEDVFVPMRRAADARQRRQLRGAHDYSRDFGGGVIAIYEHTAIAIGLARRAKRALLEAVRDSAKRAEREVIQSEVSRIVLELDAAELLAFTRYRAVEDTATGVPDEDVVGLPALSTYVTELAHRCVALAARRAGSRALFLPNRFETLSRDITAAQAHTLVGDINYAVHGRSLIGAPLDRATQ